MRFPEFSGEWECVPLSTYAKKITEKNKGNKIKHVLCNSATQGIVPQSEYFDREIANNENTDGYYVVRNQDFVYNPRKSVSAPYGPVNIYNGEDDGIISPLYLCMKIRGIDKNYLLHYFKSPAWYPYIYQNGDSGVRHDRVSIKDEVFLAMPVSVPNGDEQRKIAKFLDAINERIATQSKIIEELKTLRGALNESLYCCCESYQELSFNDVGVSYSGLSGKSGNDFGSGYPFIPYTNIFTNNIIDEGQLEYVQVREDESQNSVCFGDLLMTLSSETPEEVGIGAVYLGHESPLYLNSFAFGIHITRTDLVYPPYLSWLVSTKSFRKFILPYAQGSTRYNLQKTDFMKAKYRFPTLERQKAISVLLSGYSSKIENEERVLNKYTALKQGLIEQLFI